MPWKITPSLYNSWLFYRYPLFDRDEEQEKAAHDEMLSVLRKEKTPDTPEQARGHLFENWVEMLATDKKYELDELEPDELACARAIAMAFFRKKMGVNCPLGTIYTAWQIVFCLRPLWTSSVSVLGNTNRENTKKVFNTWRICISGNQSDLTI